MANPISYFINYSSSSNLALRWGSYPPCPVGTDAQTYHEGYRNQLGYGAGTYTVTGTIVSLAASSDGSDHALPLGSLLALKTICTAQPSSYSYDANGNCIPNGFTWITRPGFTAYQNRFGSWAVINEGDQFTVRCSPDIDPMLVIVPVSTESDIPIRQDWGEAISINEVYIPSETPMLYYYLTVLSPGTYTIDVVSATGPGKVSFTLTATPASVPNTTLTDETSVRLNTLLQILRNMKVIGPYDQP